MSLDTLFEHIDGVLGATVANTSGELCESLGGASGADLASVSWVLTASLGRVGLALGLGSFRSVVSHAPRSALVAAAKAPVIIAAELRSDAQATAVLQRIMSSRWVSVGHRIVLVELEAGPKAVRLEREIPAKAPPAPRSDPRDDAREARRRLRRALASGQIGDAQAATARLERALEALHEPTANLLDPAMLDRIIEGVGALLTGDPRRAMNTLGPLGSGPLDLRFAAQVLATKAGLACGELEQASTSGAAACAVSAELDPWCRGTAKREHGLVLMRQNFLAAGRRLLDEARMSFAEVDDNAGLASCWLGQAASIAALARQERIHVYAAQEAAEKAAELAPDDANVAVLRAKLELRLGSLETAQRLLVRFTRTEPIPIAVERELALVKAVRDHEVPHALAVELSWLQDSLPSQETVDALRLLESEAPGFALVREALAWKLLGLGEYRASARLFKELSDQTDLAPDLQARVRLGLGCITGSGASGLISTNDIDQGEPLSADVDLFVEVTEVGAELQAPSKAVFSGELHLFAVPDVLEFLRTQRRTGTLFLSSRQGTGVVHLSSGFLAGASTSRSRGLGEILTERGLVTEAALEPFLREPHECAPHVLGARLVSQGLVEAEGMRGALTRQIHEALRDLVGWSAEGQFAFNSDVVIEELNADVALVLDLQHTLLEVFKELDEEGC